LTNPAKKIKYVFMKVEKICLILLLSMAFVNVSAQDEGEKKGGFKKENLFVGGTVNLAFGNQITALGISPFLGYSINKYVDVAASLGIDYISQRDYTFYNSNDKLRQTIYGPGAFVRIFPVKFLFTQAQYEFNFIRYKYLPPPNSGMPIEKNKYDAHSLLVGGGYAGGRDGYNKSFYYISILWDVANSNYSPYKDYLHRSIPIIRAGYNIALFQGKGNRD
jgi:hypothetical protein